MFGSMKHKNREAFSSIYDSFFLHKGEESVQAFGEQMHTLTEKLEKVFLQADKPFPGRSPDEIKRHLNSIVKIPEEAHPLSEVLNEMEGPILKNSLYISHERSMAHLHCPPILPGILAELIIGALNQSMDSWDQSPSATYVEEELVKQLLALARFPETSDGVFTSGGTQSNFMGLLMARDAFCYKQWNHNVHANGLPEKFQQMRVLCSEDAHFSVAKSVSQLGLGEQAIVPIKTDKARKIDIHYLRKTIEQMKKDDLLPFAIVATCGTTDFGSIDPFKEIADLCQEYGMWLHVDAAYGGGLLFSHAYKQKIDGLYRADSLTLDFHKLCYQPISCGLFLIKDRKHFRFLSRHVDYLNPKEDEEEGILNLVGKSVQTTRRFDALKVLLTLKTVGTNILGNMIDHTLELTQFAAAELQNKEQFALEIIQPELSTVVFQYRPNDFGNHSERNRMIQQSLYNEGKSVIAKTSIHGETYLKFTILNPRTTKVDILAVIKEIERIGATLANGGIMSEKC